MRPLRSMMSIPGIIWRVLPICLFFFIAVPATKCSAQYDDDYISYDDFYQSLSPYGQWIEDPEYGYVWSPMVDGDFRPYYTNGYWVTTEYGNTWVSDYRWGWACFHYGRWTYDQYYGWLWIPGNNWGPAWVSWRYGEGFYGWAPLGPDYRLNAPVTSYYCPEDWWVFIPPQYIYSGNYYRYWYGPRGNSRVIQNTTVINNTFVNGNTTYITGPNTAHVRQVTGKPVQVYKVRNSRNYNTRVHDDVVRMYRPNEIRPTSRHSGSNPVPPNTMTAPQRISRPQSVSDNPNATPPFRNVVIERNNSRNIPTPGTNTSPTAEPVRHIQRTDNNPYEWDASKPVKQEYNPPVRQREAPKPAPSRTAPIRPAPQRETPAPAQPAPTRQQPAPAQPAPARPAPNAPTEGGRRR